MTDKTWLCPLCSRRCAYGTNGCEDPHSCDEPKNANAAFYLSRPHDSDSERGVGISEISNENKEE